MAFRSSINLLKKVDFPTFGLPTIATKFDIFLKLLVVTKFPQFIFILSPVILDLYMGFQKNFFRKEFFHFLPCLNADFFKCFSSLADQDSFLAFPFYIDFSADADNIFFFIKVYY